MIKTYSFNDNLIRVETIGELTKDQELLVNTYIDSLGDLLKLGPSEVSIFSLLFYDIIKKFDLIKNTLKLEKKHFILEHSDITQQLREKVKGMAKKKKRKQS